MLCAEVCKHFRRIYTLHLKASSQEFILHWQKFNEPNLIFARKLDENRFAFGGKKHRTGDEGKESVERKPHNIYIHIKGRNITQTYQAKQTCLYLS